MQQNRNASKSSEILSWFVISGATGAREYLLNSWKIFVQVESETQNVDQRTVSKWYSEEETFSQKWSWPRDRSRRRRCLLLRSESYFTSPRVQQVYQGENLQNYLRCFIWKLFLSCFWVWRCRRTGGRGRGTPEEKEARIQREEGKILWFGCKVFESEWMYRVS